MTPSTDLQNAMSSWWLAWGASAGEAADIEADAVLAQALCANTEILAACAEIALHSPNAHVVLFQAGRSLGEAGQVTTARDHYHHLAQTTATHLGPDHPDTLTARHSLAWWQREAGDVAGATTATAELLDDFLRMLGPDHPDTLTARHNLAWWQGQRGNAAGAASTLGLHVPAAGRVSRCR
ncbi:tetratricopeptide repeat protein [Streptomyces adustus]